MRKEVQDIIDLVNHSASDLDRLPKFVSDSYNAMPPVAGFGALGNTIQSLLNEIIVLKDEISFLKQRRIDETVNIEDMNTIKEILADLKNDVRSLKSDIMTNEVIHAFGSPSAPPLWQDAFPFSLNTNFRTPMRINRASDLNPEAASYADVELMLLSEDVNLVKNVDPDWCAIVHVSDRSSEGILEGRPKKGVAILWKNTLSSFIKPVYYNDCVIGIKILTEFNEILLLNVHLPYDGKCAESLEKFEFALSSINTLIEEANTSSVVVVGDFNANFDVGRFGRVLRNFIDERGLKIGDLGLQTDSFTYLSPGHDTTSWLDHVICSECMLRVISDVKIHYDMCLYDHFPLSFTLGLGLGHGEGKSVSDTSFVMWNKLSVNDKTKICSNLDDLILTNPILNHEANYCYNYNCKNADHLDAIQKTYAKLIQILKLSTNEFSIVHKNVKKCVPEWNEFVKDLMAGVPALIVNIVKVMYSNQFVSVKYGDKFSYKWQIGNGVRQGGILSPSLFNLYINDLINAIDNLNTGCKLGTSNANIICYADDIVLLAPSAAGLQRLVDEIVLQAGAIGLKFNVGKSVCMVFKVCEGTLILMYGTVPSGTKLTKGWKSLAWTPIMALTLIH
ncbi:unnamed protein product [Rotaria magnacalcarata]|uniref:Reverse transcriptase domain-containing protein n=1 Tax=Rotaria magnacalcarata TaxID=392030 RepID=A0A819WSS9_9BILA|nr:unnamed protein product [Rotaria magnacalcarata]